MQEILFCETCIILIPARVTFCTPATRKLDSLRCLTASGLPKELKERNKTTRQEADGTTGWLKNPKQWHDPRAHCWWFEPAVPARELVRSQSQQHRVPERPRLRPGRNAAIRTTQSWLDGLQDGARTRRREVETG